MKNADNVIAGVIALIVLVTSLYAFQVLAQTKPCIDQMLLDAEYEASNTYEIQAEEFCGVQNE